MIKYADDLLILIGLILLGIALWQAAGVVAVLAFAGVVLLAFGIVFGLRQRSDG